MLAYLRSAVLRRGCYFCSTLQQTDPCVRVHLAADEALPACHKQTQSIITTMIDHCVVAAM